mmetsp:Transcript_20888/g.53891  ORF Transcript_20888/g.53891 Transcript_20888/m.53891 type:complete len:127 (-) Transcript_20888:277-657(-)
MRAHLGEAQWRAFVEYAELKYKDAFVHAFTPESGLLSCVGPLDGGSCPHAITLRTDDPCAHDFLDSLHLDHDYDLANVCAVWQQLVPASPRSWRQGIRGARLCRMLFDVSSPRSCVHFRTPWYQLN